MEPYRLSIPPGTAYVAIVRLAVASLARTAGLDEERVEDIRIAVSEACTNAVLTNDEAGSDEPILVTWSSEGDRVVVSVSDSGKAPADEVDGSLDSQGFSSRLMMSVALVQEIADEVSFESRPDGGTTARLVFAGGPSAA